MINLEKIKEGLKKISPPPWKKEYHRNCTYIVDRFDECVSEPCAIDSDMLQCEGIYKDRDADFIANAPICIAELVSEVERLKEYEWMYKDLCK